tara:strand:- start:135 stop:779 length:645 start_codon:yes stop_codon:yes gene_type:complete
MGDLTIGTKAVLSQSGSDEAVLSGDLTFPSGHIIQVVSNHDNAEFTFTMLDIGATAWDYGYGHAGTDYTGIDVTITPASTSNKLWVTGKIFISCGATNSYGSLRMKRAIGGSYETMSEANCPWHALKNTVHGASGQVGVAVIGNAFGDTGTPNEVTWGYLDSPNTTSAVTYRMNCLIEEDSANSTAYVNASAVQANNYGSRAGSSFMTVMEVAG